MTALTGGYHLQIIGDSGRWRTLQFVMNLIWKDSLWA